MLFPSFGQDKSRELTPVRRLMDVLRTVEKKSLSSYEQQILLLELYEQAFHIFNHEQAPPHRPLALVEMHPKELVGPFSREARLMHRFATLKVGEIFNISFTEFLNQTRERVEMMLQVGELRERAEVKTQNEFQRTIGQAGSTP